MRNLLEEPNLSAFFEDLKNDVRANMEAVADETAEAFADQLRAKAPTEKQVPGYRQGIEVARNPDGTRSVVVRLPRSVQTVGVDEQVMLTFKAKSAEAKKSAAWLLLSGFGPWTPKTLIVHVDERQFETRFLKIRAEEFAAIEKKQTASRERIATAARAAGLVVLPKPKTTLVASEDIALKVLRVEKGVDSSFAPHWTPAIRALRTRRLALGKDDFAAASLAKASFVVQAEPEYDSQQPFSQKLV